MSKSLIFYSHSSENKLIVNSLDQFISQIFRKFFNSYNSSNLSNVGGDLWRKKILENISRAEIVIILLTPESERSAWVMYEAGACWMAAEAGQKKVIPCLYGLTRVPSPLDDKHSINLLSEEGLQSLVAALEDYSKDTIELDSTEIKKKIKSFLKKAAQMRTYDQQESPSLPVQTKMHPLQGVINFYKINGNIAESNRVINYLLQHEYISSDEHSILQEELLKLS